MTSEFSPEGISPDDQRILKFFKITKSVFRKALHLVFMWGCKKKNNESLEDYLMSKGMSNREFKKKFDKTMLETMQREKSEEKYDVSLLWACIKLGCDNLAEGLWHEGDQDLESLCTSVKNYRNRFIHENKQSCAEADLDTWCTEVTEILEKLVESAGSKYIIPDHDTKREIKNIKEQIVKIKNAQLEDPKKLREDMVRLREEQRKTINEDGKSELSEQYKDKSKIDPASFVTGKRRLEVKNVFTKLEVIRENKGEGPDSTYDIEHTQILTVKTEKGKKPAIITVEGDAGVGKTTLAKKILSDWNNGSEFEGLNDYDLVLYAEGKIKNVFSYLELIQVLMPTASCKFADDDLIHAVQQLKVLLVMDGFDELNEGSQKLINELIETQIGKSNGKLHLLITTRPSKLCDLLNTVNSQPVVQTKLKGISVNERVGFVKKLHDEMRKEGISSQDTQELVNLMEQSQSRLGEHYRMPLNLTLLTYLWAEDPKKVNPETTATGLYIAILELLQSRLLVRLQYQMGVDSLPKYKGEEVIREFLQELYTVCLKTLSSGSMELDDLSTNALREKCKILKHTHSLKDMTEPQFFNNMTEAFLVIEKEWTSAGYKTYLTVPHKSIMEFYAANKFVANNEITDASSQNAVMSFLEKYHVPEDKKKEALQGIVSILKKVSKREDAQSFKKKLEKHFSKICKDQTQMTMYQNMFLHLIGLLAHHSPDTLQGNAEDLVEILKDTRYNGEQWLNVLVEAKCNAKFAELVAPHCARFIDVRDGHIAAALVLFRYLENNTTVRISLINEVEEIPQLDDMLRELSKSDCDVDFYLKQQWKHSKYGDSDGHVESLLPENHRCKLIRFMGRLKTLSHLPQTLKDLSITLNDTEHAKKLLGELSNLMKNSNITHFRIHVMPDVQPDGLSPLPGMKCCQLYLSRVSGDLKAKCDVIRALQPLNGMFNSIRFPLTELPVDQYEVLINGLGKPKIKLGKRDGEGLFLSSSIILEDQNKIRKFVRKSLGCNLQFWDWNDSSNW